MTEQNIEEFTTTPANAEATPTPSVAGQRDAALKKSYQSATKRLREAFPNEFNQFRVEEAKALGYEWVPPKSEEQKAQEEYEALLAKYPHLAESLSGGGKRAAQG